MVTGTIDKITATCLIMNDKYMIVVLQGFGVECVSGSLEWLHFIHGPGVSDHHQVHPEPHGQSLGLLRLRKHTHLVWLLGPAADGQLRQRLRHQELPTHFLAPGKVLPFFTPVTVALEKKY